MRRRHKKQPIGWMGAVVGRGPGTSLGKGRWGVIDSTGQWIASGFTTQAYALRWIDGFNLMKVGYRLEDEQWILAHWYPARPVRQPQPKRRTRSMAPTESSKTKVPTTETATKVRRPLEIAATNPGKCDP